MKKFLAVLLSAVMIAGLAIAANADILTWDDEDETWWNVDFDYNLDPGSEDYVIVLRDGTICGNNGAASYNEDAGNGSGTIEENLISNLNPGWYEAAFCDAGDDCSPANGKVALILRGSTTFTVKNTNAKEAGAFAALILNNGVNEFIDESSWDIEGSRSTPGMSQDYATIPNCSISTEVTLRILHEIYGNDYEDLYDRLLDIQAGEMVTGLEPGGTTYVFIGTIDDYAEIGEFSEDKVISAENAIKEGALTADDMPDPIEAGEYPISGTEGDIITGQVIGLENGYGDDPAVGAKAAFDGDPATYFDPLGVGDGWAGIDAGEPYLLDKVAVLSRANNLDRFKGAKIQGSNDGENWTTLWTSPEAAESFFKFTVVTEFEHNTGYSMFRYFNDSDHGDVAEVEFYGKPGTAEEEIPETTAPETAAPETEAPTVEDVVNEVSENVSEAVENTVDAVENAVSDAANAVSDAASSAVDSAKSGCGSFIGGGLIVLISVLGSAWIAKRK